MLGFRRAAARSQALAAASTGVWTDFGPIFAVRLNHCVCPRPLQVLQGTGVPAFELHDSQSHRAREGGQDCNDVQQVRMLCFGGIDGQGYRRVARQGVNVDKNGVIELIEFVRWSPQNKKAQLDDR